MGPDPSASGADGPLLVQPSVELKLAPPPSWPRTHCGSESASMRSDAAKVAPVAAGPGARSDAADGDGGTYIGTRRSSAGAGLTSGADAGGINPAACPCERSQSGSAPSSTKSPAENCCEPGAPEAGPQLVVDGAGAGSGPIGGGAIPQLPAAACEPGPANIGAAGIAGATGA